MLTLTGPMQLRLPWNGAISSLVSMSGRREKQNWPPGLPRCVTAPNLQLLIRERKLDMFPGIFDRVQKSVLLLLPLIHALYPGKWLWSDTSTRVPRHCLTVRDLTVIQ
jgi:hypothetical protein